MRTVQMGLIAVVGFLPVPAALAYENYIPLGTGYSAKVEQLPAFDSQEGVVSRKTDVYETEIYLLNKKRAEQDRLFNNFSTRRDAAGVGTKVDY